MQFHSFQKFQLFNSLVLNQTEECVIPYVLQESACVDRAPHESFAKNTGIELSKEMLYILNHEIIFLLFPWFSYSFLTHCTTKEVGVSAFPNHDMHPGLSCAWYGEPPKEKECSSIVADAHNICPSDCNDFFFWAVFLLHNTKHCFKEQLETYVQYKKCYQMIETLSIGSLF